LAETRIHQSFSPRGRSMIRNLSTAAAAAPAGGRPQTAIFRGQQP
jgi:hypothetical protein